MEINQDNYFEVAEAMHAWLTMNHRGQWSPEYAALSRSEFRPGPTWSESGVEKENVYFPEINDGNWQEIELALNTYMDSRND